MTEAAMGLLALSWVLRDWLYYRAVERYRGNVKDHDQVVEFAAAIRRPFAMWVRRPP
ncbi:MAG TPA: hypothetical protein VNQ77_10830 [Frankiaceae bacterium]|nr:hypothetical protein [Frankiaceae bacterium]